MIVEDRGGVNLDASDLLWHNDVMIRPLHDFVFIRLLDADNVTAGGLHIPDAARETPPEGIVVAVGPGLLTRDGKRVPVGVEPGERVVFARRAGQEFETDEGEKLLVVKGTDILAGLA